MNPLKSLSTISWQGFLLSLAQNPDKLSLEISGLFSDR
jgi:hypothetical protein